MVPEVVLELVNFYKNRIPLKIILETLEVSSSTYHRWKSNPVLNTSLSDNEEAVIQLCKETKYLYGYRKITALLRRKMQISHNTVQRIMQKHHLNCRVRGELQQFSLQGVKGSTHSGVGEKLLTPEFLYFG